MQVIEDLREFLADVGDDVIIIFYFVGQCSSEILQEVIEWICVLFYLLRVLYFRKVVADHEFFVFGDPVQTFDVLLRTNGKEDHLWL